MLLQTFAQHFGRLFGFEIAVKRDGFVFLAQLPFVLLLQMLLVGLVLRLGLRQLVLQAAQGLRLLVRGDEQLFVRFGALLLQLCLCLQLQRGKLAVFFGNLGVQAALCLLHRQLRVLFVLCQTGLQLHDLLFLFRQSSLHPRGRLRIGQFQVALVFLAQPFGLLADFLLELLGAHLALDLGITRFVNGKGGVAVGAFDLVRHGALSGNG